MEDEQQRLYPSRQNPNPRNLGLGFLSDRPSSSGKPPISSDPPQKPPPPILDRFRSLLRDRDEQMRDSDDRPPPPPTMEEIVALYEDVLSELIFNSKPIITELTIIAGEHKDHGEGIADAICARILEVPIDQKLPSLYLLDSIVKNIGRDYVRYFAARLPEVFCEAYKQVHPNLYPSMRHLFGTWSAVFPSSVLHKIEAELRFSPPANRQSSSLTTVRPNESPSPRPAHGIHVNPKYLEARRQFEHSTGLHETDPHSTRQVSDFGGERIERNTSASPKGWSGASSKFHVGRGVSSNLRAYGRNSTTGYGDYDDDAAAADVLPPEIEAERVLASSNGKFFRPSSPKIKPARSLSPPGDGFIKAATSERDIGRVSPSRSGFGFSINQVSVEDGKRNDWHERHWSDDGARKMKTSGVSNLSNGHDQQRPRALIDAYGNYRGKSILHDNRLPKFEKPDVNGINSNTGTRNWQNIEEEEYDWEDMSPALVDRNRGNDFVPSDSSFGSINVRAGIKRPNAAIMDPSFTRNDWRSHSHLSQLSKRKTDDILKMLHTILFGRRGKAFHIKNNISQFSGFVWHNNEEKQRAKVKEKLDKCVKDKLLEFCDVLDIPVVKTAARKEDLVVKLLDFMVAPYATTDVLLAEKDQSNKAKRQRRTGSRSGSKRSRGTTAKRSATKRRKIDTPNSKEKESAPETEDENEEDEEEDNENGIPDEDEDGTPEPSEMEEKEDEPEEEDDNDSGSGSHGSKKSSKKGFSTKTAKGSDSEEEDGEDKGKGKQGPKRSAKGKSASKVEKGSEPEEEDDEDTGKGKQGSKRSKGQSAIVKKGSDSEKEDDEVTGKGKQRSKRSTKGHSVAEVEKRSESEEEDDEAVEDKRGSMKSTKRSYAGKFYTKKAKTQKLAPATTPPKSSTRISNNRTKAGDSSDSSPRVFSQKKNEDRAPKKSSTPSKTASKAKTGKNVAKGRDKSRKKESGPSEEDLRNQICEILKEVDFNTATFTDILKQLARRFDTDLTPRKAVIKIMIQEELTRLADEEEENEDDGKEENPESVGVEA